MNELFGVSMTLIMWVLLVVLGIALSSVAFVALRNRVMFKLGIRNIPRRRSQTVLIVLGLMLSTVIISAAFTTGDTVNRSVSNEVYSVLGSLDETISARGVTPENIADLETNGGVEGYLVGGASLDSKKFLGILNGMIEAT